jgi:C_GCAxxG_C_C family probable redox protein
VSKFYSNKVKYAVEFLMKGYMCSESIVMAYANEFGLEPEIAPRISGGFAGGMAQGKTYGAVTGAIIVIGLKYGAGLMNNRRVLQELSIACFLLKALGFRRLTQRFS